MINGYHQVLIHSYLIQHTLLVEVRKSVTDKFIWLCMIFQKYKQVVGEAHGPLVGLSMRYSTLGK